MVNTQVEPNVEYAYQALALDERRRPYYPTIWERPAGQSGLKVLKQTWFPGVHSDVGGSYEDADLANVTLAWMISQLEPLITFNKEVISREIRKTKESHEQKGEVLRDWGLGKIHNSMSMFFRLFGSKIRRPQEYHEVDPKTRRPQSERLQSTNEFMHSSVRIRMGYAGLGYNDKGVYDPPSLEGWRFTGTKTVQDKTGTQSPLEKAGKMKDVVWKKQIKFKNRKGEVETLQLEMPEDGLEGYEREVLSMWPRLMEEFDSVLPGNHPQNISKANTYPTGPEKGTPKNSPNLPHLPQAGAFLPPERADTS